MQRNILEANPSAELRVYVVWMPVLVTDGRSEVDEALVSDPRARHFWDGERAVGTYFAQTDLGGLGSSGIVWDAFFLFGPGAAWEAQPSDLTGSGAPVISRAEELRASADALF